MNTLRESDFHILNTLEHMVPKCFTTPRELGQDMIYKGNNLKFALTDLDCKIMNLGPKKSGGIFKNNYNKMITYFCVEFFDCL